MEPLSKIHRELYKNTEVSIFNKDKKQKLIFVNSLAYYHRNDTTVNFCIKLHIFTLDNICYKILVG